MNVLLVKTSSLGDIVHTLPALTDAKAAIPEVSFDWVVEESFTQLPKMHTAVQDVIPIAWRRCRKNLVQAIYNGELKQTYNLLRQKPYDLIIDAQGLIKSAIIAKIAQGPAFGYDQDSAREKYAAYFYDHKFKIAKDQHAILRMRKLFAAALNYLLPDIMPDYGIKQQSHNVSLQKCETLKESQRQHCECFLRSNPENFLKSMDGRITKSAPCSDYIVFLHGASREEKCWQEEKWIELARFANLNNLTVYLPWGNTVELERAKRIAQKSSNVKVLPKLDLNALAMLFESAKVVVSVDTGLAHLAAAVGAIVVALYGKTNPSLIGTVGFNKQIHLTDFSALDAADVWELIVQLGCSR